MLVNLVKGIEVGSNINKNNADHAILFEAIKLVIHYKDKANEVLRKDILILLGKFISVREANIKCLALETIAKLSNNEVICSYLMREHMNTILENLRDSDLSIRRRALDLIFALCDQENATNVVNELLVYLSENDFTLKEELVLKIAILAEKFALNLNWYVDVIVKLITIESAGDYVSDEIRFRVCQILTGFGDGEPNFELQKYASLQIFLSLKADHKVHETMVKLGASVLPEFGYHIADAPGKSYSEQFDTLYDHYLTSSSSTKAMILSALMKFCLQDSSVRDKAMVIFKKNAVSWDEDIQQRAAEYVRMLKVIETDSDNAESLREAFDVMPTFPESIQNNSVLIKRMSIMKKKKGLSVGASDDKDGKDLATGSTEEFKSTVSSVLSKSKTTGSGKFAQSSEDLFGGETSKPTTSNEGDELDLLGMDMGGFSASKSGLHPFIQNYSDHFVKNRSGEVDIPELKIENSQDAKWKGLIPLNSTDGAIYEDDEIRVNIKFNISSYLVRVLVEYVSMDSQELSEIQTKLNIPDGMMASISPTKYPSSSSENPKSMIMVMLKNGYDHELQIAVRYQKSFGDKKIISFKIPVLINKFIESVDMDQDRFDYLWNDITSNRPDTFEKLDLILKNPAANASVSVQDVLKKLAKLLAVCLGLKVLPPTDRVNFTKLCAVGQVNVASSSADFPSGPDDMSSGIVIPLMVECEFYPDVHTKEFRFSVRSNDKVKIAVSFAQALKLFVNSQ